MNPKSAKAPGSAWHAGDFRSILLLAYSFSHPHLSFSLHYYFSFQGDALQVEQAGPRGSKRTFIYILREWDMDRGQFEETKSVFHSGPATLEAPLCSIPPF